MVTNIDDGRNCMEQKELVLIAYKPDSGDHWQPYGSDLIQTVGTVDQIVRQMVKLRISELKKGRDEATYQFYIYLDSVEFYDSHSNPVEYCYGDDEEIALRLLFERIDDAVTDSVNVARRKEQQEMAEKEDVDRRKKNEAQKLEDIATLARLKEKNPDV